MNFYDNNVRKQIWEEFNHAWTEASVRQMQLGVVDKKQIADLSLNVAKALIQRKYPIPDDVLFRITEEGFSGKFSASGTTDQAVSTSTSSLQAQKEIVITAPIGYVFSDHYFKRLEAAGCTPRYTKGYRYYQHGSHSVFESNAKACIEPRPPPQMSPRRQEKKWWEFWK
jgi:hypothetical protein